MPAYFVTWQIEIDADSPIEAAQQALELMRDTRQPSATELDVIQRDSDEGVRTNVGIISPRLRPAVKTFPTKVEYLKPVEAQLFRSILEDQFAQNHEEFDTAISPLNESLRKLHADLKSRATKKAPVPA